MLASSHNFRMEKRGRKKKEERRKKKATRYHGIKIRTETKKEKGKKEKV